jgi:hypothetical protein
MRKAMKSYRFEKDEKTTTKCLHEFIERELPKLNNGHWQLAFSKPTRTDLENKTLWGWIRIMSDETGQDQRTLYQYFTEKYNPQGCTYFKDGRFSSGGTSDLNTKQFAQLLTEIKAEAASEFGIYLPTSKDVGFDDFYSTYCK